jgi:hypothetical protein
LIKAQINGTNDFQRVSNINKGRQSSRYRYRQE